MNGLKNDYADSLITILFKNLQSFQLKEIICEIYKNHLLSGYFSQL